MLAERTQGKGRITYWMDRKDRIAFLGTQRDSYAYL